jgi:acyl-CoA synthetase (AMP-forming)/AMP-acid ligase II
MSGASGPVELRDDSIAIGRGLAARGVGRGTRVALLMPNRADRLAAAFGVWRCAHAAQTKIGS